MWQFFSTAAAIFICIKFLRNKVHPERAQSKKNIKKILITFYLMLCKLCYYGFKTFNTKIICRFLMPKIWDQFVIKLQSSNKFLRRLDRWKYVPKDIHGNYVSLKLTSFVYYVLKKKKEKERKNVKKKKQKKKARRNLASEHISGIY